jgi:hypothetical protein
MEILGKCGPARLRSLPGRQPARWREAAGDILSRLRETAH